MKIIKKELLSATILCLSLVFTTKSFADTTPCPSAEACGPCGYVAANAGNLPSDAIGVNPLANLVASAEEIRCRGFFSGFYLGAAYGLGDINYWLKTGGVVPPFLDNDGRSYHVVIADGGFNLVVDHFFLGAEVGYNYRSRSNPISFFDLSDFIQITDPVTGDYLQVTPCKIRIDINSQHAATADLLPGIVFDRFVAYLRLGIEQTQYKWKERFCFPFVSVTTGDPIIIDIDNRDFLETRNHSTRGYRLGVGVGYAVGPHVSFHLNYIHTFGDNLTLTPDLTGVIASTPVVDGVVIPPSIIALNQLRSNIEVDPQRNEVNIGVKFRF